MLKSLLAVVMAIGVIAPSLSEPGAIVLIGGVLRYDNEIVWRRIIELAGGEGATFVVLPAASSRPQVYGNFAVRALQRYGAVAELLSAGAEAKLKDAAGVFFTGGPPQTLAQALYRADGTPTPLLAAIREVYLAGGVIAGANPGHSVVSSGIDALQALQAGLPDQAIQRGLGLISERWLLDQHFFTHGQFAVSLVAMRQLGIPYGLGVGVNAAVIITSGRHAEVVGAAGALVVDFAQARFDEDLKPFNLKGGRLSYLDSGDRIDLETLKLTPHAVKLEGFAVDPKAAGHEPWFEGASFYPDIFAQSALVNLIFSALDSRAHQGVGLASADPKSADAGFRFRFYPGTDSVGWFDNGNYTVSNICLDVIREHKKVLSASPHLPAEK